MSAAAELGFRHWQPEYAKRGIPTFPVRIVDGAKIPAVRNHTKIRLPGSAQLALKFGDVLSLGFMCGPRTRVTVIDMDSTDEAIVAEGERLFGPSSVIWRTGGDKFAMAYRYNGEPRRIRAFGKDGPPIDILGRNGFAVAPPSAGVKRPYEFCRGTIADFDKLPVIRGEIISKLSGVPANDDSAARIIPRDVRNHTLFRFALRRARVVHSSEELIDELIRHDRECCVPPIDEIGELTRIANSAWGYQMDDRNLAGMGGVAMVPFVYLDALADDSDAAFLFLMLRRYHARDARFALGKAMAGKLGWTLPRFRNARAKLVKVRCLRCIQNGGRGPNDPPIYAFS